MVKKLYDILGISTSASETEIKSKYRKLARKYHPDLNKDDKDAAEKFKKVSAAYAILGDPDKRKKYDNNLIDDDGKPTGFSNGFGENGGYHSYSSNGFGTGGFDFSSLFGEDIFSQFSGMGNGRSGFGQNFNQKGKDVSYKLTVSFLDAVNGTEKNININGKQINIRVPVGTKDGQVLRLKGQGTSGYGGGQNGDALITIHVLSHPYFIAEGNNIFLDLPITFKEAILGTKVVVPTISGKVNVTIPPYSSSGEKLRIKGKGIKSGSTCGDEFVNLIVVSPKNKNQALEDVLKNSDDDIVRSF